MANKKEFQRDMSFVDRQGKVVHPSREDYNARKSAKVGKAYAFFDCKVSKGDIEKELPFIRECVKTPNELELTLTEGVDWDSDLGKELQTLSEKSIKAGKNRSEKLPLGILPFTRFLSCQYFMQATYANATNSQTADEVASVLNQAYQSPLYEREEQFRGRIVYEERGRYVFRE